MTTAEVGLVYKHLEARSLRALAVWAKKRDRLIPNVPTTGEEGFPNLLESSWQAFFVPLKTPEVIVKKLEKAFKETLNDKDIIEAFEKAGWVIENLGSKDTAEFLAKSQKRYVDVAKAINMVPK
jgi:tripartite-type tricarboxylate transporter receptor subunit TctC